VRKQPVVEDRCRLGVAEPNANLAEVDHARHPVGVAWPIVIDVALRGFEEMSSGSLVAELQAHQRTARPPRRQQRVVGHDAVGVVGQLIEPVLLAQHGEQ
jgi:hypothetical protein